MDLQNIENGIVELIRKAETQLPEDVVQSLKMAYKLEEGIAKIQIGQYLKILNLPKNQNDLCAKIQEFKLFLLKSVSISHI